MRTGLLNKEPTYRGARCDHVRFDQRTAKPEQQRVTTLLFFSFRIESLWVQVPGEAERRKSKLVAKVAGSKVERVE